MQFEINIAGKIARFPKYREEFIVCGNSDYTVAFTFDEEWDGYHVKTARFSFNDKHIDVPFTGNVCTVPPLYKTKMVEVGVFAGDIKTTTPAQILCRKGALCDAGTPADPEESVYNTIMEMLNNSSAVGLKEVQNISSIDTIYNDVSALPTSGVSNGTRWVALTNGKLPLTIYTFSATTGEWSVVDEVRGSTAYIVLSGAKAGMYRFTMASPYFVSVESHTLEEAKDYTNKKIANLIPTEGLVYELNSTGEHYGCSGIGTATAKDIVIASEYNGVPVKYVAGHAFKESDITSVTIPSSVVDIATNAFENCKSLKRVNLSNGLERIGEAAFYGCSNLTDISLPTTLKAIYGKAFEGCIRLLQIYIPNTVTMVKYQAFRGCVSLVSAYWSDPKVAVEVGEAVFNACSSLNRIRLPKLVTSIPAGTYVSCESITSLNIPDNATSIGTKAYQGCDALINIIIPKNVTTIGLGAFYGCDGLKTITFPDTVTQFVDTVVSGEQIEEITVPFVGRIKGNTIYNKFKDIIYTDEEHDVSASVPSLKKVVISSACDTMAENAFEGVSGVTICCQAESKPDGWHDNWNAGNLPVIWGYGSEAEEIAEIKGSIGDISTALDELHAYAQSLIGGDSE
jgi:hypothetical protein